MRTLLLVEDDPVVALMVRSHFAKRDWVVLEAGDGAHARAIFESEGPDIVVLDLQLPDASGMELLEEFRRGDPDCAVIMLTANADLATAVEAIRRGAENFLAKPVDLPHLEALVERAHERVMIQRERRIGMLRQAGVADVDAHSPLVRSIFQQVGMIARTDVTVLLQGETGTGKGWIASRIHAASLRAGRPLVDINCAGLSATFLESELFGHEKGAFTDAKTLKRGLLEYANGGTVFLDEIGELAPELQPKLLKVLETRRFRRLGGTREIEVDVRLLAATNRELTQEVREGRFREDLYYRLAVYPIALPPLRDRAPEDLGWLIDNLLAELRAKYGWKTRRISDEAMALLRRHRWPGNIRELRNLIERALIQSGGEEELRAAHLPLEIRSASAAVGPAGAESALLPLQEVERRHVLHVLDRCAGNRSDAARVLQISRRALYNKLGRFKRDPEPGS